ncbi:YwqG family protein [Chenggangzhangella methanolivorans]|uniref:DUF1963 domain-containing protein n=1 Tax=Chenggangzhangella methanolivorans TaxID=1437009 RepID=A0A9E6REB2_9HYPH|nr:YwqG family protein [Chenggangzhangella methanolivorans]QZO01869.1 DUF1963 domain-containing protein [Chenggangzhangella methanolivorans]
MFDDVPHAREALAAHFDPPRLERVVSALVPAIVFAPVPGAAVLGGSRIGGAPDMGPGAEWPRPAAAEDPEAIAKRGSPDAGKEMLEHFARNLPYAFFAQVDLGEAARLGPVASALPSEGRLLFFYDVSIGPWDTGSRVARVIWDKTPDQLARLAPPADLKEAADADRAERVKLAQEFDDDVEAARKGGSAYDAPGRPMRLQTTLRLPSVASIEVSALPEIFEAARSVTGGENEALEAYEAAIEENHDGYTDEKWRRQQLLGAPQPEQDDPRYDAVVVTTFGKQHLEREEWRSRRAEIEAAARDWTLLLQADVGDWMQARFTEGTVFFVIRKDDLAARRFDRVVAVYQQT